MIKRDFAWIFVMVLLLTMLASPTVIGASDNDKIEVDVFYDLQSESCSSCEDLLSSIEELEERYPEIDVEYHEVHDSQEEKELLTQMAKDHDTGKTAIPMTIIGGEYWSGYDESHLSEMESKIQDILDTDEETQIDGSNTVDVPFLGEFDLDKTPFLASTIIISFIDGFNPCSLWLLTFLLGILILTKSRKKMLIVGMSFLLTTSIVYGAFIAGLFNVFAYTRFIEHIKWVVGGLAVLFAVVNIKDYFWYKKGISFTISDKQKPTLFKKMRRIMHPEQSLLSMVGATIALALGVTLVELPCTAGFPMIWGGMASELNLHPLSFLGHLALYLLIYMGIEIVILTSAVITMSKIDFSESHGRILKLISGVIMLVLGISFVFLYDYMNSFQGLLNVMITAFAIIMLTLLMHRKVLPRLGIHIGTEDLGEKEEENEDSKKGSGKEGDGDE